MRLRQENGPDRWSKRVHYFLMDIAKVYPRYGKEGLKLKNWGEYFLNNLFLLQHYPELLDIPGLNIPQDYPNSSSDSDSTIILPHDVDSDETIILSE
jgi:hypothetical protein